MSGQPSLSAKEIHKLNRSFSWIIAGGLGALAAARYFWDGAIAWWLIWLGVAVLTMGFFLPSWLDPVRRFWMRLAAVLGAVNSRILLTVVFAGLLTPLALLLRLLGRQPIQTAMCRTAATHWHKRRPEEFTAQRMERQF